MKRERKRVDLSEIEQRVGYIAKLILSGYSKRYFILQEVSKNTDWGVCDRQIDNYIKSAKALIQYSYTKEDIIVEKDIALNRLEGLYTMNLKIQDYRECRNVVMDRAKLLGLSEPEKIEQKTTTTIINLGDGEEPKK